MRHEVLRPSGRVIPPVGVLTPSVTRTGRWTMGGDGRWDRGGHYSDGIRTRGDLWFLVGWISDSGDLWDGGGHRLDGTWTLSRVPGSWTGESWVTTVVGTG